MKQLLLLLAWVSACSCFAQTPAPAALSSNRLLAPAGPLAAQQGHRYWDAPLDSLQRVLATQRADTADINPAAPEVAEAAVLSARLHRPEQRAYRLLWAASQLTTARSMRPALDSMQAAIAAFDQLGHPAQRELTLARTYYNVLNQQEAKYTYYSTKLAYYQKRGAVENMAACYHTLGGYYVYRGDYNQAIGHY
jgi:two-component system NtrC family sensor kinase